MGQEAGVGFDDKGLGPIVGWPRAVFSCWQRGLGLAAGKGTLNIGPKNTTNVGPKIKYVQLYLLSTLFRYHLYV